MGFRRWVGWLAVAGILLHAATIARHNVVRFHAIPAELAALAGFDQGIICHVDSEAGANGSDQGLPSKDQDRTSKPCPICLGLASAHALTASDAAVLRIPQAFFVAHVAFPKLELLPAARYSLPLTRGPPSAA